jgi:hypothetical protein
MYMHGIRASILLLAMGVAAGTPAYCQGELFEPNLANIAAGKDGKISNRTATAMDKEGLPAIHFDERAGDGLALWPEVEFSDGTIEFDVRGKDVFQQSFVGVAFHGQGDAYEAVYFRPFNFRTSDPARRNHAVQYVSNPAYTWERLRKERPEAYEKPILPAPDPNGWIHARIVVKYPKVSTFVNGAAEASLVVEQLSDRKAGWVGLWVGNGSGGEFANLRISSVLYKKAALSLQSKPIPNQEPKMTEHFRATIEDAMRGGMRPDDYTPEFWNRISSAQKDIQADLNRHGGLISLTLVDIRIEEHGPSYRYILEFRNARALQHFVLDEHYRIALIESEGGEPKPNPPSGGEAK